MATYIRRWRIAVSEDNDISENQQRGLRSLHHKPGRFVPTLEANVYRFNNWLLDRVLLKHQQREAP